MHQRIELPLALPLEKLPLRLRFGHPLTDAELQEFCERQEALHVEREPLGELDVRPMGGTYSGMIASELLGELHKWNEQHEVGAVLPNVGFFLRDGSMRGPRIAWVSQAKWRLFKEQPEDGFLRDCPDFVMEVVSFNRTHPEWHARMEMWTANGVALAWLLDPERKVIEIHRPGREPEIRQGHTAVHGEGPVAGFVLELSRIWN